MEEAHVVNVIPNEYGGGAEALVRNLHDELRIKNISCEKIYFCGASRESSDTVSFNNKHYSLSNSFFLRKILKRRLKEFKKIIVHSHLTHGFFFTYLATLGLNVKWVHTEHSTSMRLRKIKALNPIESFLYRRVDKVVAISNGVKSSTISALRIPDHRITVILNGAKNYGHHHRPPIKDRKVSFISVGSLRYLKGFDIAIKALSDLTDIDWSYKIVGEGNERSSLEMLCIQLGVAERGTFTGWDDPSSHYNKADIQLIPSRWEGFGLVAVEGMSTGIRVIASDVPGLREVVGEDASFNVLVKDHESPLEWKKKISELCEHIAKLPSTSSHDASKRSCKFSLELMAENHISMYNSLSDN